MVRRHPTFGVVRRHPLPNDTVVVHRDGRP